MLAPFGQGDKGSSAALLISTMEQPLSSINALVLTLSRLAQSCTFKWLGYIMTKPKIIISRGDCDGLYALIEQEKSELINGLLLDELERAGIVESKTYQTMLFV